ncbi:MAG: tRNA wybutosine-synthesizing 3 family protein [Nanoarchaeota archaeon]
MYFDKKKKNALRTDKSKKGYIDEGIRGVVDLINSFDNMFTTSSCAGRVSVIKKISGKKDLKFLFCSHNKIKDISDIKNNLTEYTDGESVWLLFQPLILHVCCRNISDASWLISCTKEAGYKRAGIISFKNTIIVEIMGTDYIEHLLYDDNGVYYTYPCLERLLYYVNKKFDSNLERISKLIDILNNSNQNEGEKSINYA